MIDEELYQLAAEELNSERRRPHIWARACALASDDHDEARYLYTNLRVEEMLAERAAAESAAVGAVSEEPTRELALEPLESASRDALSAGDGSDTVAADTADAPAERGESDAPDTLVPDIDRPDTADPNAEGADEDGSPFEDPSGLDLDADATGPAPISTRAGTTSLSEPLPELPSDAEEGETAGATSVRGEPVLDLDAAPVFDLDPTELERHDDTAESATAATAESEPAPGGAPRIAPEERSTHPASGDDDGGAAAATAEWLDDTVPDGDGPLHDVADGTHPIRLPAAPAPAEDLDWLDQEISGAHLARDADATDPDDARDAALFAPPGADDALARELARQADELPDRDRPVVIAQRVSTEPVAAAVADAHEEHPAPAQRSTHETDTTLDATGDATGDAGAAGYRGGAPLELDDALDPGADVEHAVFVAADGTARTVRQGNSWSALLFTLPWLLRHGLLGTAIAYALFAVVVLVGLALTAFAWLDAGESASLATRVATIGFALLALFGLLWVPLRRANGWREDRLERRGFGLVAYVRARRPERAVTLVREALGSDRRTLSRG